MDTTQQQAGDTELDAEQDAELDAVFDAAAGRMASMQDGFAGDGELVEGAQGMNAACEDAPAFG